MKEPTLTLVHSKSLADQIADSIVEGIANGAIAPGQKIVEAEIANELKVSRIPVREALKILHAQGIVTSRPHHGVRVVQFDDRKIVQIYEVRCALEKIAARDACKRRHALPLLLKRLDSVLEKMSSCQSRGDFLGVSRADLEFHWEICLASHNEIVITIWKTLSRHMLIVFEQELMTDSDRSHIVEHHRTLRQLIERKKPKEFNAEIERHIMRLRNRPSINLPELEVTAVESRKSTS
jgi:DNA-binding GntR family transcriptional regulator